VLFFLLFGDGVFNKAGFFEVALLDSEVVATAAVFIMPLAQSLPRTGMVPDSRL